MKDLLTLNKFVKNQAEVIERQQKQIESLREAINLLNNRLIAVDKKRVHLTEKVRRQESDINAIKNKSR